MYPISMSHSFHMSLQECREKQGCGNDGLKLQSREPHSLARTVLGYVEEPHSAVPHLDWYQGTLDRWCKALNNLVPKSFDTVTSDGRVSGLETGLRQK